MTMACKCLSIKAHRSCCHVAKTQGFAIPQRDCTSEAMMCSMKDHTGTERLDVYKLEY